MTLTAAVNAATYTWANNDGTYLDNGNWAVNGNWDVSGFPNGTADQTVFPSFGTTTPSGRVVVTLDQDVTVSRMQFDFVAGSGHWWEITGANTLTLDSGDATRALVTGGRRGSGSGNHPRFFVPIQVNSGLQIDPIRNDAILQFSGPVTGTISNPDLDILFTSSSDTTYGNASLGNEGNDFGLGMLTVDDVRLSFGTTSALSSTNAGGGPVTLVTVDSTNGTNPGQGAVSFGAQSSIDFGTNVHFVDDGSLTISRISLLNQTVTIGDLTLDAGVAIGLTQTWGYSLAIGAGDELELNAGSSITQSQVAGGRSGDIRIFGSLIGSGAIYCNSSTNSERAELIVESGGALAPGSSAGQIDLSFAAGDTGGTNAGSLIFQSGATFAVELLGTTAGSGYDQVTVSGGGVDLGGATLSVTFGSAFPANTPFVLIDNDGTDAVIGTFDSLPEGSIIIDTATTTEYELSYVGGDGNDVVLTVSSCTQCATYEQIVLDTICNSLVPPSLNDFKAFVNTLVSSTVVGPICPGGAGGGSEVACETYILSVVLSPAVCETLQRLLNP